MDLSTIAPRITIQSGRPLRLTDALGERIAVMHGHVWVTQADDPRDVVLSAGEDFLLDRRGLALVTALDGDAVIARLA